MRYLSRCLVVSTLGVLLALLLGAGLLDGQAPVGRASAAVSPTGETASTIRTIRIAKGDTLFRVLLRAGVDKRDAAAVSRALRHYFDPRKLRIGQRVSIRFGDVESGMRRLLAFSLQLAEARYLEVVRNFLDGS